MIGWLFVAGLKVIAAGLMAALVLGWLQNFHPAFDSFSHFRHLLIAALAIVLIALLLMAAWKWASATVAVLAISALLSFPFLPLLGPAQQTEASDGDRLRVLQFNMRFNNRDIERIAETLTSVNADVLALQELTPQNFGVMELLKDRYPFQLECTTPGRGSVALASRHPFVSRDEQICIRTLGIAAAQIELGGETVTFASFHSKWPWPATQKSQIDKLEKHLQALNKPLVFAGDFNSAPWSAAVKRTAALTGTRIVPGLIVSWKPAFRGRRIVLPPLLALDQIMASPGLVPVSRRTIRDGGSDHLPILTEFRLEAAK